MLQSIFSCFRGEREVQQGSHENMPPGTPTIESVIDQESQLLPCVCMKATPPLDCSQLMTY